MNMSEAVSKKHSLVFVSKLSDKKCRINSFLLRLIGLLCNFLTTNVLIYLCENLNFTQRKQTGCFS